MSADLANDHGSNSQQIDSQFIGRLGAQMELVLKMVTETNAQVADVNRRMTLMEAQNTDHKVELLMTRVRVLEDANLQQKTVIGVADWLPKYAGWFFMAILVIIQYLSEHHIIK